MTDEQLQTAIRAAVRTDCPTGVRPGRRRARPRSGAPAPAPAHRCPRRGRRGRGVDRHGGCPDGRGRAEPDRRRPERDRVRRACRSVPVRGRRTPCCRRGHEAGSPTRLPRSPTSWATTAEIVAILFGGTLHSPPSDEVNNKILWVATTGADPGGSLEIDAVRAGTSQHVSREVPGGPGPSTIDLPAAGCWHLELTWGERPDQQDSMDLDYVRP